MSEEFLLQIFPFITGFIIGSCLGSFSSALLWRIPRGISWTGRKKEGARSRCPSCQRTLRLKDLIPIISWLLQKGECRTCGAKISFIYPFLEILWGLIGATVFCVGGLTFPSFIILLFSLFLFVFLWVGLSHKLWSRQILIILFFLGILFLVFTGF